MVFEKTDILLPKVKDHRKWAVVACDQFTSQPEYWENVQKYVGDEVSTYNLILPEAQLSENNDDRIANINETMNSYLKKNIFEEYNNSYVYVERKLKNGAIRKGIVGAIDLEDYDYRPNAKSKIRATEKTVIERIPPRVKIRENADIELPHILLLCDDQEHQLLESVEMIKEKLEILYDFDLMQEGGHITGWLVSEDKAEVFDVALEKYFQDIREKYHAKCSVLRDFHDIYTFDASDAEFPEPVGHFDNEEEKIKFIRKKILLQDIAFYLGSVYKKYHSIVYQTHNRLPEIELKRLAIDLTRYTGKQWKITLRHSLLGDSTL